MAIKDIITEKEETSVRVEVPIVPVVTKKTNSRGKYVAGRSVPSKQVKAAHRKARSGLSLKTFLTERGKSYNLPVSEWLANK